MATLKSQAQTVAEVARNHLTGRIRFETVEASPMVDHYGDEYFRIWVVYDSKAEKLDPKFRTGLYQHMRPELLERGIACDIDCSFVDRTEHTLRPELAHAHAHADNESGK